MSGPQRRPGERPLTGYLLIAPSLLLFGAFFLFPLAYNLYLSLLDWDMLQPARFIGVENYTALLEDDEFGPVVWATLGYSVASTALSLVFGLLLAIALQRKSRINSALQACVFSSYIVSWVGVSLLWLWLLDPTSGILTRLLDPIGLGDVNWLGDPNVALWTLVGVTVWKSLGYTMIVYLAGLRAIPEAYYEAAELDGASGWRRFRHVTWPLLRPTTAFLLITSLIMAFQAFDVVRVMTQGGPAGSTSIYVYWVYEQAFLFFRTGYSAAAITVFFAVLVVLTIAQYRAMARRNATGEQF